MNSVTYDVTRLPAVLTVGRQTETGVMAVRIDCTGWLTFWPGLTLRLFVTAPGGAAAYPATTHMEGKVLVWDVSSSDTQTAGKGTLEVVGEAPGKRKLSAITETNVLRTTTAATTEPPAQIKTWFDEVMRKTTEADEAVMEAKIATANANAAADRASTVASDMDAATPAIVQSVSGGVVAMRDSADRKLRRVVLENVADDEAVSVTATGANLLNLDTMKGSTSASASVSGNALTLTALKAVTYAQASKHLVLPTSTPVVVSCSYELESRSNEANNPYISFNWYKNGSRLQGAGFTMLYPVTEKTMELTPPEDGLELGIVIALNGSVAAAIGDTCTLKNIMVNVGDALPYAPHVEQTVVVDSSGEPFELRSFYPNTTVYNSAGAHMTVDYVVDTKTYIDNLVASAVAVALANK